MNILGLISQLIGIKTLRLTSLKWETTFPKFHYGDFFFFFNNHQYGEIGSAFYFLFYFFIYKQLAMHLV